MKSIANQYRDLKEGKMSQANFMRNLRMSMPQVTNTMSFGDAIKVLKNKGIITEVTFSGSGTPDEDRPMRAAMPNMDRVAKRAEDPEYDFDKEEPNEDAEFDAILKQLEDEMAGEIAVKSDVLDEPLEETETLNEAKEKTNPNKVHPQEYTMGIKYELKCFKGDVVKAERTVLKNLAKEPFYYTALKLSGKDAHQVSPAVKAEVSKKKAKKKEVELVDAINAMQKVKMPKKEEKKKLKEQVDEKMRFQDLPADSEKYKIVRDSKNYIIKATNADGVEFQKGDNAKTYDGEEIKIVKFEESQGKVKAIYNKGMFFAGIDIDGLEAPKETMRPGVNIGGSFEKMKAKLAEMVKKAMAEFYDGRDNLTNISDDTK